MKAQAHAEIEEKLNKEELPGLLEKWEEDNLVILSFYLIYFI